MHNPSRLNWMTFRYVDRFALVVLAFAHLGGLAAMVALLVLAGFELGSAVVVYFDPAVPRGAAAAVAKAIKGLEFVFLAPLPFLAVNAVFQYVLAKQHSDDAARLAKGQLVAVKAISVSLLIAVVAATLVGMLLFAEDAGRFEPVGFALGMVLIVVLGGYLLTLEYLANRAEATHTKEDLRALLAESREQTRLLAERLQRPEPRPETEPEPDSASAPQPERTADADDPRAG